jgi:hypothetical protein
MDLFKANCWNLVCAKVGISVSEGEVAKEEDLWLLCRRRFYETKDNLPLQSNVSFIFNSFSEEGGWPEEVLHDLNTRETRLKIRPSWVGLKLEVVKKGSDALKMNYYFGSKIWEQWKEWKECKKYIHNHLNPNWTDPSLLKSGYNISSLLQFVRESTFHFEANKDAKDNVRCIKKREKLRENSNWKDIKNAAFNERYSSKINKMKNEGWYPEEWFTFLAYGAPAKIPSPSLYIVHIKNKKMPASLVSLSKRKFKI